MSLSGSMWTGVSGLLVHGEKMNVVGHNIANVNTIGYKSQRMDFQDLFYKNIFGAGGPEQMGMGARVGTILTDFSQGSFEQTGLSTDLAIQGKGWFQVAVPYQDNVFYTRAGDFSFNKEGELKTPHGYILQGWSIRTDADRPIIATGSAPMSANSSPILTQGVPTDIKLDTWTVLPRETSRISTYVNLAAGETDHSIWKENPFAALFNSWDGLLVDDLNNIIARDGRAYLAEDAFAYASPIKIYDDAGVAHTVTIYFDKVDKDWSGAHTENNYDGGKPSQSVWEYIVTINPAEDMRMFWNPDLGREMSIQTTRMAGILMTGTMTYGSNGDLIDLSSYTLKGGQEAVKKLSSGDYELNDAQYVAVWTDPNGLLPSKTFQTGGTTTITAGEMPNTAFYPIVETLGTWEPVAMLDEAHRLVPQPAIAPQPVGTATVPGGTLVLSNLTNATVRDTTPVPLPLGAGPEGWRVAMTDSGSPPAYTLKPGCSVVIAGFGTFDENSDPIGPSHPAYLALQSGWDTPGVCDFYITPLYVNPGHEIGVINPLLSGNTYNGDGLNNYIVDPDDLLALYGSDGDFVCSVKTLRVAPAGPPDYEVRIPGSAPYTAGVLIEDPDHLRLLHGSGDIYCYQLVPDRDVVRAGYHILDQPGGSVIAIAGDDMPDLSLYPFAVAEKQGSDTQSVLMSWYPADVSNSGLPLMVANFTSVEQAHTAYSPLGKDHLIEMDFGITIPHLQDPWRSKEPLGAYRADGGPFAMDGESTDPEDWAFYGYLAGITGAPIIGADHCRVTGSASSATMLSRQNGYTYGNLMDIYFDQHGVMNGIYSNGVTLPLYQIALYDFVAPQHLRMEGGNLVSQTRESGEPSWGAAGVNGFGTVNGYMIEQSNVDLAKEMVHMITTQRGFQANSKVITSVDTMMEVVVNMKR